MTIYLPAGTDKTASYYLDDTHFTIADNKISVLPDGVRAFASDAQAIVGTSTALMVNPANLTAFLNNYTAGLGTYPTILDASVQNTTVGNTANETNLYSFSIPAGTLGTTNAVLLTMIGTFLQNNSKKLTLNLKYGSTTVASAVTPGSINSATTYDFKIEGFLVGQSATNAQFGMIHYHSGYPDSDSADCGGQGTGVEDSTGALNLVVSAKWDGADANAVIVTKYAILQKIPGV
jgi:hypothetical protein